MASRREQLEALAERLVDDLEALAEKYEEIIGDELEVLRDQYRDEALSILLGGINISI